MLFRFGKVFNLFSLCEGKICFFKVKEPIKVKDDCKTEARSS